MKTALPIACAILLATVPVVSFAQVIASDLPYEINWIANSDVLGAWSDMASPLELLVGMGGRAQKNLVMKDCQFAVCSADFKTPLVITNTEPDIVRFGGDLEFLICRPAFVKKLEALGDGTFHAAYLINGKRASNILTLTIDHTHVSYNGPSLHLQAMSDPHSTAMTLVAAWFVQGDRLDTSVRYSSLVCSKLVIDGVETAIPMGVWRGADRILAPHQPQGALIDLEDCRPAVKPAPEHDIQFIIGNYKSPTIHLALDNKFATDFDALFSRH
ncbi:MAG: hypothetical protein WCD79_05915 [Chthoniobacteraceae bacterium]